jgi:hypothetical protein
MMGMVGQELKGTRGPNPRETAIPGPLSGLDGLRRAGVAVVAFGLLMALWVMLWIPTAPVP